MITQDDLVRNLSGNFVCYFCVLVILHCNTKYHKNLSVWPFDKTFVLFVYKIVVTWLASNTQKSFQKFICYFTLHMIPSHYVKQILPVTIKTIKLLLTVQGLRFRNFSKLLMSINYCKNFSRFKLVIFKF